MKPDDIATAITQALVQGGAQWMVATIVAFLPALWTMIFFQPNIVANAALPITGPIAALCLLLALAVKLSRRVDDDVAAYRLATAFLVLGATIYYGPLVFAVEAASQTYLSGFGQAFTSNTNPTVALALM